MPQVVKVEHIRKKGRLAILVIPGMPEIALEPDIVAKYSIRAGVEIPYSSLDEIRYESELLRAENYVTYLLSRRAYSYGLLKNKMMAKQFEERVIKATLAQFRRRGLVDDAQFARQTVESLLRRKPAGRGYLISYLESKRVARKVAETAVDEAFAGLDESEIAVRLLRSRWNYLSKFELETARAKAYNYLSRRSIGYRAAKAAFEKLLKKENEN
jgi:SOS response regulatory protein OraA/RecX